MLTMTQLPAEPSDKVRRRKIIGCGILAVCVVLAGIYGIGGLRSNPADAACRQAVQAAA
jgi:hypothetical protein